MNNLFILNESVTSGFYPYFLNFFSIISILSGLFVIISKNPIISILFLIGLFLSISLYLMGLGLSFIGLSYLLVYVGAVSILFIFILMLINVRISELVTETNNSIPLAIFIGILFNSTLYEIFPRSGAKLNHYLFDINKSPFDILDSNKIKLLANNGVNLSKYESGWNDISFVSSQSWDSNLSETSHITTIGSIIYTAYPIWLIITSIILLLAMVGAIVITIKQKK